MKRSFLLSVIALALSFSAGAQAVSKRVVVEHFTNSYCSVCASRNPGFYNNLWQFPQVLHLAVHPSQPYSSCTINKHNKTDNDSRALYYNVFGSTPRLVIQGKPIPASTNYSDAGIFQNELGQTTAFDVQVSLKAVSFTDAEVRVVVKKVDASSITNMRLYGAIVQDTFFFNANNGETVHYDVLRDAVWDTPMDITAPANVGDSMVYTQTVTLHQDLANVYAMVILNDAANKEVVQAAKSGTIPVTTSVNETISSTSQSRIYPNPAHDMLYIEAAGANVSYIITDMKGIVVAKGDNAENGVNVAALGAGVYMAKLNSAAGAAVVKFVKQ